MAQIVFWFVICACTSKYFPVFKCFLYWILTEKKYILTISLSIQSTLSCIFVIIHNHWHFSLGIGGLSTCTVRLTSASVHQVFFQGFDSKFWMFKEYFVLYWEDFYSKLFIAFLSDKDQPSEAPAQSDVKFPRKSALASLIDSKGGKKKKKLNI